MKRYFKMLLLVFFLGVIYSYFLAIEKIPEKIVAFEGENITLKTLFGVNIKGEGNETVETLSNDENSLSSEVGSKKMEVSLFNTIPLKEVNIDVIPKTTVIPVGSIAGVKLYTNGVLVVRNVRNRRRR